MILDSIGSAGTLTRSGAHLQVQNEILRSSSFCLMIQPSHSDESNMIKYTYKFCCSKKR
jgi:hypothetical protein